MDINSVYKLVRKLKNKVKKEIVREKYDNALSLISSCANILYQTNIYYCDEELENYILEVAKKLKLPLEDDNSAIVSKKNTVVFYDGFGLNDRGLAQIYLKALCECAKVVYVTYEDRSSQIPDIIEILNNHHCEIVLIKRNKTLFVSQILQLSKAICNSKPEFFFYYSFPDDVVGTTVMAAYCGKMKRVQINLTDHAFWLGVKSIDKCIEFREYGARVSNEYRKIPKEKICIIPFYPILHCTRSFEGFPFELQEGQKVIFSGGSLYKTLGAENKYYQIVEHIIREYDDTVFWYAGSGDDTELIKLIKKYPKRIFYTPERADLFQVLKHCYFYLSTYPMAGGLMLQYSVLAGKIPVTLRYGNALDGILINQDKLQIEFNDMDSLYEEVKKLIKDEQYYYEKSLLLKDCVITPEEFNIKVRLIIENDMCDDEHINYAHIETGEFQQLYLENLNKTDLCKMLARKEFLKMGLWYFPIEYLVGVLDKLVKKRGIK